MASPCDSAPAAQETKQPTSRAEEWQRDPQACLARMNAQIADDSYWPEERETPAAQGAETQEDVKLDDDMVSTPNVKRGTVKVNLVKKEAVPPASGGGARAEQTTIMLTQAEFDALPEYSCTLPTGTTIGKRWKCGIPYGAPKANKKWSMGEYTPCDEPGMVGLVWRKIIVAPVPAQPQGEERRAET